MIALSPAEKDALGAFARGVRTRFASRVRQIALFGSRARGDADEWSDIDVCVVIDGVTWEEARDVDQVTADVLESSGVLLSPFVVSTERMELLQQRERAIAEEIRRDGIPL